MRRPCSRLVVGLLSACFVGLVPAADLAGQSEKKKPTTSKEAQEENPAAAKTSGLKGGSPALHSFTIDDDAAIAWDARLCLKWAAGNVDPLLQLYYRVDDEPGFAGASWNPVDKVGRRCDAIYTLPTQQQLTEGQKVLYLQLMHEGGESEVRSDQITYRPLPEITAFRIDDGARTTDEDSVRLSWSYTGTASHYRVSEDPRFAGATWTAPAQVPDGVTYGFADPRAGTKTVYLELRRMDSPGVRARATIRREDSSVHAFSTDVRIHDVIRYAASRGYQFVGQALTDHTECRVYGLFEFRNKQYRKIRMSLDLPTGAGTNPGLYRCRFRFFHGKTLEEGWRISDARVQGLEQAELMIETQPGAGGGGSGFSVLLTWEGHLLDTGYATGKITRLVLEGPAGADWREAFR